MIAASVLDVVTRIRASFTAKGVPAPVNAGPDALARELPAATGRVVLIPQDFKHDPPKRLGGNPRQIYTKAQSFEIHVWGRALAQANGDDQYLADLAIAEQLTGNLCAAMASFADGAQEGGSGKVNTDIKTSAFGVELVFSLDAQIAVIDSTWPSFADGTASGEVDAQMPNGEIVVVPST